MSVSLNSSVGKTEEGLTYDFVLASNSFFLRILAREKAETLGAPLVSAFGTSGVLTFGVSIGAWAVFEIFTAIGVSLLFELALTLFFSSELGIWGFTLGTSTIE
ncbi:hypothetical protein [Flavobacterium tyrosinilyticum]|uniref:hypothetical protein n=1 Tax=Flavobacterium tyrosinilyticum TaxID=1658740 RepID=UPI00203070F3|nr:hypothetical protein [Flavobacterium tyrosinilyticum]MCM0667798.1 hypothetical protein [Flavobacterium tyrosinilyticum]